MRLVGDFPSEREAYLFHLLLTEHSIASSYEPFKNPATKETLYHFWIVEEEDWDPAFTLYRNFQGETSLPQKERVDSPSKKWKVGKKPQRSSLFTLTFFFILLCVFLFFVDMTQRLKMEKEEGEIALFVELTPLERSFLFDYPQYLENFRLFLSEYPVRTEQELEALPKEGKELLQRTKEAPTWKGISDLITTRSWKNWTDLPSHTLFGKIRKGEIWRLFTPALLHANLLHILFNMLLLWILGRKVEARKGTMFYLCMVILIGTLSNVAQYLMGGPDFMGFSGILVGLAGFIWVRQKIAPWESYPISKSSLSSLFLFVLSMLLLELLSMSLQFFHVTELSANIANTGHIVGGLAGMLWARILR